MPDNLLVNIILAYTIIGIMMYGGGVIDYDAAGPVKDVANIQDGNVQPSGKFVDELEGVGASITGILGPVGGVLVIMWQIATAVTGFIHWPIVVLATNNVPPKIVLVLGAPMTLTFYLAVALFLRNA